MKKFTEIWVDACEFTQTGGWKLDTQFVHLMGGGYLIAADIPGTPVEDAVVSVEIPQADTYRIWARTRNWLRPHNPGTFNLLVNGESNGVVLGKQPSDAWVWEIAGDYTLEAGKTSLALHDLTGYFGRCASILITNDFDYVPAREIHRFQADRARIKGLDAGVQEGGSFDVIIAGGGPGGVPAAIAAARHGAKVLLIHNRPVLGGNASSEVGITMDGASAQHMYSREGGIAEEIRRLRDRNPSFHDDWTEAMETLVAAEKNITVMRNYHVCETEMESPTRIRGVVAQNILTLCKTRFEGKIFIDCTGDGWMGYYAGAKFRFGREAGWQHKESIAPKIADTITMSGCIKSGNLPFFFKQEAPVEYHAPYWVPELAKDDKGFGRQINGDGGNMPWWLEISNAHDDMYDGEQARDALLMAVLGYYDHIKNYWSGKEAAANLLFRFASVFIGRRESRRFIGDYVLTQADCVNSPNFPDAVAYAGWIVDVHHPEGIYSGEKGTMDCIFTCPMATVPLRSLYSVNIENLFFAGRNISTTHVAMGTTRVENTIATFGQAVGTAAAMCVQLNENPRGIYENHIHALQQKLLKDDQFIPGVCNQDPGDPCLTARASASSVKPGEEFETQKGEDGGYQPLEGVWTTSLCLEGIKGEGIKSLFVQLRSENDTPTPIRLRAVPLGPSRTYFVENPPVYEATAMVPPKGDYWVEVPVDIRLDYLDRFEQCFMRVSIGAAPGISWRLSTNTAYTDSASLKRPDGTYKRVHTAMLRCTIHRPIEAVADCGAHNVINGLSRITDAQHYEWVSDPAQALPQWICLDLEKPTAINSVSLAFNTDLSNPGSCWHPGSKVQGVACCVKDYTVEIFDGKAWIAVAEIQENFMRKRTHRFDTITARKIRVTVNATWGDPSARIMEIRAALEA